MCPAIEVVPLDPSEIDLVAPLWRELLDHIAALPEAAVPIRPFDQSWPIERQLMLDELERGAFALAARCEGRIVGYVFVRIEGADPVWYTGAEYADIAHLSVAERQRGKGVGGALLDAVDDELLRRGVVDVQIGVDRGNDAAVRFYERRGYRPDFQIFYGSPGNMSWACVARDEADRTAGRGRYAPPGPDGAIAHTADSARREGGST
jgi:ribosomal protein S18 acetylase RimI-like enzyme